MSNFLKKTKRASEEIAYDEFNSDKNISNKKEDWHIEGKLIFSRNLHVDGCQACLHNIPGLESGLWCISNCVNGSRFKSE
ncbi:MAG: hypothetical protein ABIP68_07170 [Ferruginibacter sp.]